MKDTIHKLETEQTDQHLKNDTLQRELAQAVNLAAKFQEKNDKLENELATITRYKKAQHFIYIWSLKTISLLN